MLMTPGEQPGRGVEAALHHEVPGAEQPRGLPRPAVPRRAPRTQHREQQHAAGCFNFDIYDAARPVGSDKYLVFNLQQLLSQSAHVQ